MTLTSTFQWFSIEISSTLKVKAEDAHFFYVVSLQVKCERLAVAFLWRPRGSERRWEKALGRAEALQRSDDGVLSTPTDHQSTDNATAMVIKRTERRARRDATVSFIFHGRTAARQHAARNTLESRAKRDIACAKLCRADVTMPLLSTALLQHSQSAQSFATLLPQIYLLLRKT